MDRSVRREASHLQYAYNFLKVRLLRNYAMANPEAFQIAHIVNVAPLAFLVVPVEVVVPITSDVGSTSASRVALIHPPFHEFPKRYALQSAGQPIMPRSTRRWVIEARKDSSGSSSGGIPSMLARLRWMILIEPFGSKRFLSLGERLTLVDLTARLE